MVDEQILGSVLGRDEAEALFRVEPLHNPLLPCHAASLGMNGSALPLGRHPMNDPGRRAEKRQQIPRSPADAGLTAALPRATLSR